MPAPTLTPIVSGFACISAINSNFDSIETYLPDLLNVTEGGTMAADINMDGNRLTNLPAPTALSDPVRLQELTEASDLTISVLTVHGQVKLVYTNATTITLSRWKGPGGLFIDGTLEQVPAAGVTGVYNNASINGTLAQTLGASTFYYVYAYMVGTTMTLDFSATGYSLDATTGVHTKTGDTTRTLVGMVLTNSSSQFRDSNQYRHVRTFYNDTGVNGACTITNDIAVANTSGVWQQLGTTPDYDRCEFILWVGEQLNARADFSCFNNTATAGSIGLRLTTLTTDTTFLASGIVAGNTSIYGNGGGTLTANTGSNLAATGGSYLDIMVYTLATTITVRGNKYSGYSYSTSGSSL